MPRHIRFGVICNSSQLFAWQEIVIKKLIVETDIELKLLVYLEKPNNKGHLAPLFHYASDKSCFLWNLYNRHWIKKKSKALQLVETNTLFAGVPEIHCSFINDNYGSAQLEDADIEKIRRTDLDFVINFSSIRLTGSALHTARYGIWSFLFGNPEKYIGSITCFWEIYNEDDLTSAFLVRLTDDPDIMIVLKEGHLKTSISYLENIDKIHIESTLWLTMICQDIRNENTDYLSFSSKIKVNKNRFPPRNLQLLVFFLIQLKLRIKNVCKLLFYTDLWNIGIAHTPIHQFLNPETKPSIQWFACLSKTRFMADPFGITFKGKLYVLYEDFRFDQGIGKTASFLVQEGSFVETTIVIDEKFHMSYPFLLEYEDEVYCIPETYQANQVRLYKAVVFPTKWKMEKVLIENYPGLDNTLLEHEGGWFLFSTNKNSGPHHHLNIHYSDSLFGAWHPHPKNPVKTDIRSVRPAGGIFEHNGSLFRPSMDYSQKIEGRISINKIVTLSREEFKEEMHTIVDPFKNSYFSDKVHTLNKIGAYTLVDGAKELFIFSSFNVFRYKLKRGLARLRKNRVS